jgi:putative endonuclease
MFHVYILKSESTGMYYVGSTGNIEERIKQHNNPDRPANKTTRRFQGPWKLMYQEEFATRSGAVTREKQIKSWKSKKEIEKLINSR